MGYMKIPNLYKDDRILEFRSVYALEKIHGTSAHVMWDGRELSFFSGGAKHETFVSLFNQDELVTRFKELLASRRCIVYGEAYGGKMQGMRETYGSELKFVAFDVAIDVWLSVPQACDLVTSLGLEFVPYAMISSSIDAADAWRDVESVQAIRNGMGRGHKREGIVLRPPFEVTLNDGRRLIAKHKRADFRETKTPRVVGEKLEVLTAARAIAAEWVTPMRLEHVLQKLPGATGIEHTQEVIRAMVDDILVEGAGEIVDSREARSAIGRETARLWKNHLQSALIAE